MKAEGTDKRRFFLIMRAVIVCVLLLSAIGASTYAWLSSNKGLVSYAPISSPEALHIGAGHGDNIRYMRVDGLDVSGEATYFDKVFCVYGSGVENYKIQLAYTTNNPFTYSIFRANQSDVSSAGAVEYVTNETTPRTFYYSVNKVNDEDDELAMTHILNITVDEETKTTYELTYGDYDKVQTNAEPIYMQTTSAETGNARGDFVNYYILRVYKNGKTSNDRETDILCIAATTVAVS